MAKHRSRICSQRWELNAAFTRRLEWLCIGPLTSRLPLNSDRPPEQRRPTTAASHFSDRTGLRAWQARMADNRFTWTLLLQRHLMLFTDTVKKKKIKFKFHSFTPVLIVTLTSSVVRAPTSVFCSHFHPKIYGVGEKSLQLL